MTWINLDRTNRKIVHSSNLLNGITIITIRKENHWKLKKKKIFKMNSFTICQVQEVNLIL